MTIPEAAQLWFCRRAASPRAARSSCWTWASRCASWIWPKKLIRAYGYEPNVDMPIKIIGLRPGEKLYEELLMDSERDKMTRTAHKKIFVANVDKIDDAQYDHMMQVLQTVEDKNDERAVEAIAEIVPTYHPDEKNRPDNKAELAAKKRKSGCRLSRAPLRRAVGEGFFLRTRRSKRELSSKVILRKKKIFRLLLHFPRFYAV